MTEGHDWGFFKWSATGFLCAFSLLYPPLWIVALGLFVHLFRRPDAGWPADLGLVAGVGLACLTIAALQDGAFSATGWALAGAGLIAVPTAVFWWLRCRPSLRAS